MAKNITEEVYQAVAQVKHPEIDCSHQEERQIFFAMAQERWKAGFL
jgi:hypothetical protein